MPDRCLATRSPDCEAGDRVAFMLKTIRQPRLHAYHQSYAEMVARFEGYVAQYLGDGVLVYFGYPVAHEDDAQHAVWSGLDLLTARTAGNTRLALPAGSELAVRLGLHTGLVVMGNVGTGERQEPLAQGETLHDSVLY